MLFKIIKHQADFVCKTSLVRPFSQSQSLFQGKQQTNSALYTLRKSTGYALKNCREAVEKFNGDIDQATKWLHEQAQKEGWAKAEKLKNRAASQGLITFFSERLLNRATLVEINCETDFVAKNEKFLDFSSKVAKSVLQNVKPSGALQLLSKDELNKLSFLDESGKTVGDQLALTIGSLGENMIIRRAVVYSPQEGQNFGWYMHGSQTEPFQNCHFGKFGALVNFSMAKDNENYKPADIGRQLAQHIVGMKPKTVGDMPEPLAQPEPSQQQPPKQEPVADSDEETAPPPSSDTLKVSEDESRLLHQEFLMKPNTRVAEFVNEQRVVVNDFVRFECGEVLENE